MRDTNNINLNKHLQNELSQCNLENSPCNGIENVSIIVNKKKLKKRKKHKIFKCTQQPRIAFRLSSLSTSKKQGSVARHSSMPEVSKCTKRVQSHPRSGHAIGKQSKCPFQTNFIVNLVSEHRFDKCMDPFNFPRQTKWKVYRCQLGAPENSCCCSCNSDAMFEVMKSLYDCYKKKNCDHCDCILCGHVHREERREGEVRKSLAAVGFDTAKDKKEKIKKAQKALEGKTQAQKESILKEMAKANQPLPEGKTPSEKSLIKKLREELGLPPAQEGLITPLKGKTQEQKEKILKGLAMAGIPLPEGTTTSEKKYISKVRAELGLPIEPKTKSIRDKHDEAAKLGLLQPLEGKTPAQKEKILRGLHDKDIPLPEGRTPSEKSLISKIKAETRAPSAVPKLSEKMREAKAEGLLTPLKGKTPNQKERILKALAMAGIPLPEGTTPSEKKIIDKVRTDLGLPIEPKTKAVRDKHDEAAKLGLLQPLEGRTPAQKEKILRDLNGMGIPLPEGRTPSEKALIARILAEMLAPTAVLRPSEKLRKAKAEGLLTPLKGKTPEQIEKALKALAMAGKALPEGTSQSEKKIIDKVRADLGLPMEPKTKATRDKLDEAANLGILLPLESKTPAQKEKILRDLHGKGIPLPEGRTPSEKALIASIKAGPRALSAVLRPSEKMRKAKAEGLLTPLKGKTPNQKERILRALAMAGIPLPEGTTPSEKKLIDKVRTDLGLPIEPKTKAVRDKHNEAANLGMLLPLEGRTGAQKEKILRDLNGMGIPLPEGRTSSEKALIAKIRGGSRSPSAVLRSLEKLRKSKAEGLLTPLKGKTPEQKEKVLKALAMAGKALPEGTTPSEKKKIDKVRADLGLPMEPKTKATRDKLDEAANLGILLPLEGKTPAQKEKILRDLHGKGIPLPEGRTPSEKALIASVKAGPRALSAVLRQSEKMRKAKAEGLLTPLKGKTPEQIEKALKALAMAGKALPEGTSQSEKKIIENVRADLGLPMEPKTKATRDKLDEAANLGILLPLEGKTPAQKEKILRDLHGKGIPLPEGRTPSEKALIASVKAGHRALSAVLRPSEKMRKAKAEGLLTPLKGKTPNQKEKILKGLAMTGIPLPEGTTPSEKKLIDNVRTDLGLPIEPKTKSVRDKHSEAAKLGLLQPLEGRTPSQIEKILRDLHAMGIPLPEGRTPSEKAIIGKVRSGPRSPSAVMLSSERLRKAKSEGLLTPLKGKTPDQIEKALKALAMAGKALPEATSQSERKIIEKVRADLGLPMEPKTKATRDKLDEAANLGILLPLEGKTPAQKEKILRDLHGKGIPLPEGRTPSEKALIASIKAGPRALSAVLRPSEKMRKAKAEGLLTPLKGKTPNQKERILRALAMAGIPLPEGTTPSEKKLIDKVRTELGLPIEPKTKAVRDKHNEAANLGMLLPLEGRTGAQKEKILQDLHNMAIPLPEGRTPSEKALIAKIRGGSRSPSAVLRSLEKLRKSKAEGLLTPLKGKTPEQKEKVLKALAMAGKALPEGTTPSEKKIIDKVRADLGLPMEPKTKATRDKLDEAAKRGLLQPLEGKTPAQKEKILRDLHSMGFPLPEGRTPSEKALIARILAEMLAPTAVLRPSEKLRKSKVEAASITSDKIRKAKAAGLFTPLAGKSPEQKEKILKRLAQGGLPLPEAKTPSEKTLINKVKKEFGIPDITASEKLRKAKAAGLLTPLEGKTLEHKEKILRGRVAAGLPLPVEKTPSEKALIQKIRDDTGYVSPTPSEKIRRTKAAEAVAPEKLNSSEKLRKAKAAGMQVPVEGKKPAEKEKIVKGVSEVEFPVTATTPSEKLVVGKAKAAGLFTPIFGKPPAEKERILRGLAEAGLPLPVGKTASEKDVIKKVRAESGLTPEPTPSEKMGKIKTKEKKVGITPSKKVAKVMSIGAKYEDITKTTTCERACGCDKKKIRFKHSYVKIRVTSPDISSICPCPNECIPGVKAGAFIDNEGIKVTVGRAIGVPLYSKECSNNIKVGKMISNCDHSNTHTVNLGNYLNKSSIYKVHVSETSLSSNKMQQPSSSDASCSTTPYSTKSENIYLLSSTPPYEGRASKSDKIVKSSRCFQSSCDSYADTASKSILSSLDSILVIKSETLSLNTSASPSMDTDSVMSIANSSITSISTHYSYCQFSDNLSTRSSFDGPITSDSGHLNDKPTSVQGLKKKRRGPVGLQNEFTIFRMSQTKFNCRNKKISKRYQVPKNNESVVLIDHLMSKYDLTKIVDRILARNPFSGASSIFIVVPTSGDSDTEDSFKSPRSATSINAKDTKPVEPDLSPRKTLSAKGDVKVCGKGKKFYMQEILSFHNKETMFNNESLKVFRHNKKTKNKICQMTTPSKKIQKVEKRDLFVGTDTTMDRPCCCLHKKSFSTVIVQDHTCKDQCVANVISGQITPLILKQGVKSDWFRIPSNICQPRESLLSIIPLPKSVTRCCVPKCPQHTPSNHSLHHHHQRGNTRICHRRTPVPKEECHCTTKMLKPIMKQPKEHICPIQGTSSTTYTPNLDCDNYSHKSSIYALECGCNDIENPTQVKQTCLCGDHNMESREEPGPTTGTRSIITETESKSEEALSQTGTKKTRFRTGDAAEPIIDEKKESPLSRSKTKKHKKRTGTVKVDTYTQPEANMLDKETDTADKNTPKQFSLAPVAQKIGAILSDAVFTFKETFCSEEVECQCFVPQPETVSRSTSDTVLSPVQQTIPVQKPTPPESMKIPPDPQLIPKEDPYLPPELIMIPPDLQPIPKQEPPLPPDPTMIPPDLQPIPKQEPPLPPDPIMIPPYLQPIPKQEPPLPPAPMGNPPGFQPMPVLGGCYPPEVMWIPPGLQAIPGQGLPLPPEEMGIPYEGIGPSCGWIDTGEIMRLRSEMSIKTSGFKFFQKPKRQLQAQEAASVIELDFEDAIRYYASMNPEKFRDLITQDAIRKADEEKNKKKGLFSRKKKKDKKETKNKKAKMGERKEGNTDASTETLIDTEDKKICNCPYGFIPPPPMSYDYIAPPPNSYNIPVSPATTSDSSQETSPDGFMLCIGRKGSSTPALGSVLHW